MKNSILAFLAGLLMAGVASAASTGKILILDNELLIEGDIRREKECYIVRRGGGETVVPASRVIELVDDRPQAYRAMRERTNLRDFDDRMHLIRWGMENGLRVEALAEAELLLKFRPEDASLRNLAAGLRSLNQAKAEPPPVPAPAKLPDRVIEVEPLDYNRESFSLFVAKVQPILMNACARCHAAGHGGDFVLLSAAGGNRKASLANLAATLKQLKRSDLAMSPLLTKAVSAHGQSTQPPFRDRQSPAFQNLESWVALAVTPEEPPAPTSRPVDLTKPMPADAGAGPKTFVDAQSGPKIVFGQTSSSQAGPEPQTEAKDPFDPAIFNGTIQPKRN